MKNPINACTREIRIIRISELFQVSLKKTVLNPSFQWHGATMTSWGNFYVAYGRMNSIVDFILSIMPFLRHCRVNAILAKSFFKPHLEGNVFYGFKKVDLWNEFFHMK